MTATPIIADQPVLDSYTFLKPENVFLMQPGETEMDVMQRVRNHNSLWALVLCLSPLQENTKSLSMCGTFCYPVVEAVHVQPSIMAGSYEIGEINVSRTPTCLPFNLPLYFDHVVQVLRMSPSEVFAVKQKVAGLAAHLNRRTVQVLQTFMPLVEDAAAAPAVV